MDLRTDGQTNERTTVTVATNNLSKAHMTRNSVGATTWKINVQRAIK